MALARQFTASHEVLIGSRDSARAATLADEIGASGSGSYEEVAEASEVMILSVPWWGIDETLAALGELDGKVVIDTVNPFTDDSYTVMVEFIGTSAAEEIQKAKPKARVVKAWNTVHEQVINVSPDFNGIAANVFVCGNDAEACRIVAGLASQIGYAPVHSGPLSTARYLEAVSGLKVRLSYDLGMGTQQAINLLER